MRYSKQILTIIVLMLLTACTINKQSGLAEMTGPLFTSASWDANSYKIEKSGTHYCDISSGYNAIKVILRRQKDSNAIERFVKSTRRMVPGTVLTVAGEDSVYRSRSEIFYEKGGEAIIEEIQAGSPLYLSWSEVHGKHHGHRNFTNIIQPDGFSDKYKTCMDALK